ncbi:MAG: type II toxin-antitoxin system Phd/YefM family antitoxin [Lachnospiraceae bacterium]|nr:type II toxin-antitoxin system Phd/YefM family antitoxin [Lachnospiraceae bacterium]
MEISCNINYKEYEKQHFIKRSGVVVMNIEDYERDRAEKKLLEKLHEAEEAVKDGNGWLTMDELKARVGE